MKIVLSAFEVGCSLLYGLFKFANFDVTNSNWWFSHHTGTKENFNEPKNLTDTIREVLTKAKQLACEIANKTKSTDNASGTGETTTKTSDTGEATNKAHGTSDEKIKKKTTKGSKQTGDDSTKNETADADEKKRDKI